MNKIFEVTVKVAIPDAGDLNADDINESLRIPMKGFISEMLDGEDVDGVVTDFSVKEVA